MKNLALSTLHQQQLEQRSSSDPAALSACIFDEILPFSEEGYFIVRQGNKYGFIAAEGEVILPCFYDAIKPDALEDDSIILCRGGKWGVYSCLLETEPVPFAFEEIVSSSHRSKEGFPYIEVKEHGLWGLASYSPLFRYLVQPNFESLGSYHDGVLQVKRQGMWGLIAVDL